jgi:hypothetical protein
MDFTHFGEFFLVRQCATTTDRDGLLTLGVGEAGMGVYN